MIDSGQVVLRGVAHVAPREVIDEGTGTKDFVCATAPPWSTTPSSGWNNTSA